MRMCDWCSDVCSSDLKEQRMDHVLHHGLLVHGARRPGQAEPPGGVGLHGYNGELPLRRAPAAPKAPMPARRAARLRLPTPRKAPETLAMARKAPDRKSTRLNSSH